MIRKGKIVNIILNFTLTRRPSVEKNILLRTFMRKMSVFRSRWLSKTSVFFTSFRVVKAMLWGCQSYALRLSLVANERLKCHKWQGQRPQMTTSEATSDKFCGEKWRWKSVKVIFFTQSFSRLHEKVDKNLSCFFKNNEYEAFLWKKIVGFIVGHKKRAMRHHSRL